MASSDLNALAARVHKANKRWWHDPATGEPIERNVGEMCMLMISELSEAMEGARKGIMDDHLPHRRMEEVEMADFLIRALDYAGAKGIRLTGFREDLVDCEIPNKGEYLVRICETICRESSRSFGHSYWIDLAIHQCLIYSKCFSLDIWGAFEDKMAYNAQRVDHTNEARLAPGGKKW